MQLKPLKQFAGIKQTAFKLEDFDGIKHFPECGGMGIFVGKERNHHKGKALGALKYTA